MKPFFFAWVISAFVFLVLAEILGKRITNHRSGILIDTRGRYSLSQFQVVMWSLFVLSLMVAMMVGQFFTGGQISFPLPQELLLLMGISLGSAAGAAAIKAGKDASNPDAIAASDDNQKPFFWQVFLVEEGSSADTVIDIAKFQNFLMTLILFVGYVISVCTAAARAPDFAGFSVPAFDDTFLVLLGISHAGYLAGKLPTQAGDAPGLSLALKRKGAKPDPAPPSAPSPLTYTPRRRVA